MTLSTKVPNVPISLDMAHARLELLGRLAGLPLMMNSPMAVISQSSSWGAVDMRGLQERFVQR